MAEGKQNALERVDPESQGSSERAVEPWRGDEHKLQVSAAKEAGLPANEVELDLFTEGFKRGMTLEDSKDKAIVLRGRTVLEPKELKKSLYPLTKFLRVPLGDVAVLVHDGKFEVRVSNAAAERASPALDSAKVALKTWIGFGLVGFLAMQLYQPLSAIIWGVGLILGGWVLRQGLVNGRSMLAGRFVLGLAMLAQEEGLVLPPGDEGALKVPDVGSK